MINFWYDHPSLPLRNRCVNCSDLAQTFLVWTSRVGWEHWLEKLKITMVSPWFPTSRTSLIQPCAGKTWYHFYGRFIYGGYHSGYLSTRCQCPNVYKSCESCCEDHRWLCAHVFGSLRTPLKTLKVWGWSRARSSRQLVSKDSSGGLNRNDDSVFLICLAMQFCMNHVFFSPGHLRWPWQTDNTCSRQNQKKNTCFYGIPRFDLNW